MVRCDECGSKVKESNNFCVECGHEVSTSQLLNTDESSEVPDSRDDYQDSFDQNSIGAPTTETDPVTEYVRKMRERPYRERITIRAGFRNPDEFEMRELGILSRIFLFAFGLVVLWFGFNPELLLGYEGRGIGAFIATIAQLGVLGQLVVGTLLLAFGAFLVSVGCTGHIPKHANETSRDLLP